MGNMKLSANNFLTLEQIPENIKNKQVTRGIIVPKFRVLEKDSLNLSSNAQEVINQCKNNRKKVSFGNILLETNAGKIELQEISDDKNLKLAIEEIENIPQDESAKIQKITNLLLEYMGYPPNTVKLEIIEPSDGSPGAYKDNVIRINPNSDYETNTDLAMVIFHELTHRDNQLKMINLLATNPQSIVSLLNDKNIRYNIIKHIQKSSDLLITNSSYNDEIIAALKKIYSNHPLKEISQYASTDNTKTTIVLLKEFFNNKYTSKFNSNSIKDMVKKGFYYWGSPNEIIAYQKQREFMKAAGKNTDQIDNCLAEIKITLLLHDKFMECAKIKYGVSDIFELTEEQIDWICNFMLKKLGYEKFYVA